MKTSPKTYRAIKLAAAHHKLRLSAMLTHVLHHWAWVWHAVSILRNCELGRSPTTCLSLSRPRARGARGSCHRVIGVRFCFVQALGCDV
eukprot:6327109-Amphidinium_carterae.1